jgi:hypothetical protein
MAEKLNQPDEVVFVDDDEPETREEMLERVRLEELEALEAIEEAEEAARRQAELDAFANMELDAFESAPQPAQEPPQGGEVVGVGAVSPAPAGGVPRAVPGEAPPPPTVDQATWTTVQPCGQAVPEPQIAMPSPPPPILLPPPEQRRQWPPLEARPRNQLEMRPDCYPETGVLPILVKLVEPLGLPPAHAWAAGISVLSAVCGRWWVLQTIRGGLRSNVYIWMLSGSGGGKGLTVGVVKQLLERVPNFLEYGLPRSANAYLERLIEAGEGSLLWIIEEGSALFAQISQKYGKDLPEYYCQAYDGASMRLMRAKRNDREAKTTVASPCPTHLVTSTLEAMTGTLPYQQVRHMFTDGFFARFLLVPGQRARRIPSPIDDRVADQIASWVEQLTRAKPAGAGEVHHLHLSDEALVELHTFFEALPEGTDDLVRGAWERSASFAQKIAVLYHVSMGKQPSEEISADTMVRALRCVHSFLLPAALVTAQRCSMVGNAARIQEVSQALRARPDGMFLSELAQQHDLPQLVMNQTLAVLAHEVEFSAWTTEGRRGGPRIYVARRGKTPEEKVGYVCRIKAGNDAAIPTGVKKALKDYAVNMRDKASVGWAAATAELFGDQQPLGTDDDDQPN